jgi:hypothetical protein
VDPSTDLLEASDYYSDLLFVNPHYISKRLIDKYEEELDLNYSGRKTVVFHSFFVLTKKESRYYNDLNFAKDFYNFIVNTRILDNNIVQPNKHFVILYFELLWNFIARYNLKENIRLFKGVMVGDTLPISSGSG